MLLLAVSLAVKAGGDLHPIRPLSTSPAGCASLEDVCVFARLCAIYSLVNWPTGLTVYHFHIVAFIRKDLITCITRWNHGRENEYSLHLSGSFKRAPCLAAWPLTQMIAWAVMQFFLIITFFLPLCSCSLSASIRHWSEEEKVQDRQRRARPFWNPALNIETKSSFSGKKKKKSHHALLSFAESRSDRICVIKAVQIK